MIQINGNDLPITVAEKIITGKEPYEPSLMEKAIIKTFTSKEFIPTTRDMFNDEEVKEIADYLLEYYKHHKDIDSEDTVDNSEEAESPDETVFMNQIALAIMEIGAEQKQSNSVEFIHGMCRATDIFMKHIGIKE